MAIYDVNVFSRTDQNAYASVCIEIGVDDSNILDGCFVLFFVGDVFRLGAPEEAEGACSVRDIKTRNGFAVSIEGPAKVHDGRPWVIIVERIVFAECVRVVHLDIGGELTAGAVIVGGVVRVVDDLGKTVKFFGGADLVTAVNQLRGDRHNGRCCNSVCYPNKGCCQ